MAEIRTSATRRSVPSAAIAVGEPLHRGAIRRWIALQRGGFLLESVAENQNYGRFSIYGVGREALPVAGDAGDPFDRLAGLARPWHQPIDGGPGLPFCGGWVGFLSYECGRFIEPFARRHADMPGLTPSRWWACDTALVLDHFNHTWYAVGCELPGAPRSRPPLPERLEKLHRDVVKVSDSSAIVSPDSEFPTMVDQRIEPVGLRANMSRGQYVASIERILEYIRAGDIYQVNFAQRFSARHQDHPWYLYERLCRSNPAMFAAYLAWDHDAAGIPKSAILSSSPELFLDLRGGHVVTRPIKGTRPRTGDAPGPTSRAGPDARADMLAKHDLMTSEKDAAELVMIVDLERNDLGRVCEFGSVCVTRAAELEEHPTVFHRVATVEGDLRPDCDAIDLLRATFPGGSITGAPKVRAMQIIDELEPDPRGPYCGAIGWLGVDGSMMLNLAIRTMVVSGGEVHWWAGGGIVADSDPAAEYDETLAKAEGMRRALTT